MHRCRIHCPDGGGFIAVWIAAVLAAGIVIWLFPVLVGAAAAAFAVVAAVLVYVARRIVDRSYAAWRRSQLHYAAPVAANMRALRPASLAIEAPRHALTAAQAPMTQAAVMAVTVTAGSKRASMTEPI